MADARPAAAADQIDRAWPPEHPRVPRHTVFGEEVIAGLPLEAAPVGVDNVVFAAADADERNAVGSRETRFPDLVLAHGVNVVHEVELPGTPQRAPERPR